MSKLDLSLKSFLKILKDEKEEVYSIYIYAIFSGLIQLILPLGIQTIIGLVIGATIITSVYFLIFLIIISVLLIGYLQISQLKIIENLQQKLFVKYALLYSQTIPNFDIKEADKYYLPENINKFFDITTIQKGSSKILLEIPATIVQIIFGLLLLSFYHIIFLYISILLFFIIYFLLKYTSKEGLKSSLKESFSKYKIVSWLQEVGRIIKTIKYFENFNLSIINTDNLLLKYITYRNNHFNVLLFQFKSLILFKFFVTSLFIIIGTYLMFNQSINIGQFVAIEIVIISIINSVEKLILSLETFYDVITGIYKVDSILELKKEKSGLIELEEPIKKIEFKNVSFSYIENQEILRDINFTLLGSGLICISGDENSGKTTLLKLFAGLYYDYQGIINFNSISLKNYEHKAFREKIGVFLYPQEVFDGSLYDNITVGRNIPEKNIIELINKLNFNEFLAQFNDSFKTKLQVSGKNITYSTRMKILLLRALINNPSMLVLKDSFNGFETETKKAILSYLLELSKTIIVIISSNDKFFISVSSQQIILKNNTSTIKKNNE